MTRGTVLNCGIRVHKRPDLLRYTERGKMKRTGSCKIQLPATRTCCLFLIFPIVLALAACSVSAHPRYQPISASSSLFELRQGYRDIQIDGKVYLIVYMNYVSSSLDHGLLIDPLDHKWLQGAQEYVLYRAAELTKSKGAKYFGILHKDDWNLIDFSTSSKYGRHPIAHPGAGLMIKILNDYPSSTQPKDDRVYEVSNLLQSLPEKNSGLAKYQKTTSHDEAITNTGYGFSRWRSSVSGYDSVPVPGHWEKPVFGSAYFKFEPGMNITKEPTGSFHIAIWDDYWNSNRHNSDEPILQIQLLRQCVALAEHEGFEVFKLEDWTVEEHREATPEDGDLRKVWFRTTATVMLQHQKDPNSLDPVFVVDEIRSNVMNSHGKP